jgi:hypothetical protein
MTTNNPCRWCGLIHASPMCPTVKAIEYHPDGTVKRVEFKVAGDYSILGSAGLEMYHSVGDAK